MIIGHKPIVLGSCLVITIMNVDHSEQCKVICSAEELSLHNRLTLHTTPEY